MQRSRRPDYRADIDGLRALAVAGVVCHHFGVEGIPGGFLGVDVFFVISGFLVTRLIANEIAATGTVDFKRFALRRLRRLFPALAFTLAASGLAAILVLSPVRLEGYATQMAASLLSLSNILFFRESGYFDVDAAYKPLLHTWSLGVEEQFYLVWPPLMLLAARKPKGKAALLLGAALVNLLVAEAIPDRSAAFFLTPFRIFEFAAGAALVGLGDRGRIEGRAADAVLGFGLFLIVASFLYLSAASHLPGALTLVPVSGASLAIVAGQAPLTGWLLRNRPAVWIGRISYSLYLVHWPLFVFLLRDRTLPISRMESAGLVAASVLAADLLHRFVETPFRTGRAAANDRRFLVGCAATALLLLTAASALFLDGGWRWRLSPERARLVASIDRITDLGGECRYIRQAAGAEAQREFDECAKATGRAVLVIGDSHAIDLAYALAHSGTRAHLAAIVKGDCRPVRPDPGCFYDALPDFVAHNRDRLDGIVFTQIGSRFLTGQDRLPILEDDIRATAAYLDGLGRTGVPVIWVGPQWEPNYDVVNAVARLQPAGSHDYLAGGHPAAMAAVDEAIAHVTGEAGQGFRFVSVAGTLGPLTARDFIIDGEYTYEDTNHWSARGEAVFGRRLLENSAPLRAQVGLAPRPDRP